MIAITPLEKWIAEKVRVGTGPARRLSLDGLRAYQLRKVNEAVDYTRRNSPFYRRHLTTVPDAPLSALSDISRIPFTLPSHVSDHPSQFLAVRQDDVARIVTLRTSGSTGAAKRLFFTGEDLELTVDFFHHGMSTLVRPGQRVAILLPGEKPDSVGDLLARGLRRMDVDALTYGPVMEPGDAARAIASSRPQSLVGIPTQVLAVARTDAGAAIGKGTIETILLSTDYVPRAIARTLEDVWGCRVFNHYGMTEMGLGGGVECEALDGYHLREGDLYFEVVDHETGDALPDGTIGEVVFTTLTRRGMPLIRYRTGDIARIIPEPCPCGSILPRMERVKGRWDGAVTVGPGAILTLADMDEALFLVTGLLDYRATVAGKGNGKFSLHLDIYRGEGAGPTESRVLRALDGVDAIKKAIAGNYLEAPTVDFSAKGRWTTTGVAKRKIVVHDDPAG